MLGFRFSLQHNHSYAFRDSPQLTDYQWHYQSLVPDLSGAIHGDARRCSKCGQLQRKWEEPLDGLIVKKRSYDLSITYDGITVASPAFQSVYESYGMTGLSFGSLPDDPGFFLITPVATVAFDAVRRQTRFHNKCLECGRYASVIGATPVFLKNENALPQLGFARTDLEFGSGEGKHPILLCGADAGNILLRSTLRGLDLTALPELVKQRP